MVALIAFVRRLGDPGVQQVELTIAEKREFDARARACLYEYQMRFQSRTGAGAAALSLVLLVAVICRCPVPMPMAPAPSERAHHHDCCADEPSVLAVDSNCCARLPESTSALFKNERPSTALAAEPFELPFAPTLDVRSQRPFSILLPSASPPLVLRI